MAIQATEAVVLNRKDLRETSITASFYSRDFGKIKGVLKGIRGDRSKYGSLAELFSINNIVFYERSKGDFQNITQCDLVDGLFGLRKNLFAIAYASYMAELTDELTEPAEKNAEIYDLLTGSLKLLSAGEEAGKIARIFELRLLSLLGFAPTTEGCSACGKKLAVKGPASKIKFSMRRGGLLCQDCSRHDQFAQEITMGTAQTLNHLKSARPGSLIKFRISRSIEGELNSLIEKIVASHIEKPLKSKKFIKELQKLKR
jgi:DNA repair protein RecO (recombination protein O)